MGNFDVDDDGVFCSDMHHRSDLSVCRWQFYRGARAVFLCSDVGGAAGTTRVHLVRLGPKVSCDPAHLALRKFAAVGVVGLGIVSLFAIRDRINFDILQDPEQNVLPTIQAFFATRTYQMAIAPMKIFSNLILSDSIWEAFGWFSSCVAANGLMVWLIIKTDENFIEQELHYSQLRAESLKKNATLESSFASSESLQTLPMLPFMGGVGPIVWRQLQTFYRMKRTLIFQVVFYFAMITCFFFLESGENDAQFRFAIVISLLSAITFAAALAMPMGFHTDINSLEIFKRLPVATEPNCTWSNPWTGVGFGTAAVRHHCDFHVCLAGLFGVIGSLSRCLRHWFQPSCSAWSIHWLCCIQKDPTMGSSGNWKTLVTCWCLRS